MNKRILFLLLLCFISLLDAKKIGEKKRILVSQIAPDTYRMRIYFNYENPFSTYKNLEEPINELTLNVPLPDRFEVIKIRKSLTYKTSLSVNPNNSYILDMVNNNVVFQTPLVSELGAGATETISFEIPPSQLYEGYNKHTVLVIQNSILHKIAEKMSASKIQDISKKFSIFHSAKRFCDPDTVSGGGSKGILGGSKIWTQIYTEDSYIEYDFKLKPFEEKITSLFKFIIDNKLILPSRINLVMPEILTEDDLNNYGLFANILGYLLRFRDVKFSVSTKINNYVNNIIIMPRDKLRTLLENYSRENNIDFSFDNKIEGNINAIQNPINNKYGFFVLTGDNQEEIESAILTLLEPAIKINRDQKLVVTKIHKPLKAKPFSSPNFIELGKPIKLTNSQFKYQKTCSDEFLTNYESSFQIYPILANKSELENYNLKLNIDYFSVDSDNIIFLFNIYFNDILTQQFFQRKKLQTNSGVLQEQAKINMSLLKQGWNKIKIEIRKYPTTDNIPYGLEAIKVKINDTSSLFIPKIVPKVLYPNLEYVKDVAFPFSIYPDLQNTGILITNFKAETIAAAMKIAFILGAKIESPGYYLTTTFNINKILDKDIIIVGEEIPELAPVYSKAPVHFEGNGIKIKKYLKKYDKTVELKEYNNLDNILIVQMYPSIFNPKRMVVEITAKDSKTIYKGVQEGLVPKNMGSMKNDVWFYNVDKKSGVSFQFQKKFLIKNILENYQTDFDQVKYKNIKAF